MLIATTNPQKVKEILAVLDGLPITLKTLNDFSHVEPPDETGSAFEENARAKARAYAQATGCVALAEDSGFEVDALDGEPGIHSARYLRPGASYPERFEEIYRRLRERNASNDTARFICALALAEGGTIVFETTGIVEGRLALAPAGSGGFGYDPILYYPPYQKTFGEVSPEQKAAVSHRGKALRAFRAYLERTL